MLYPLLFFIIYISKKKKINKFTDYRTLKIKTPNPEKVILDTQLFFLIYR